MCYRVCEKGKNENKARKKRGIPSYAYAKTPYCPTPSNPPPTPSQNAQLNAHGTLSRKLVSLKVRLRYLHHTSPDLLQPLPKPHRLECRSLALINQFVQVRRANVIPSISSLQQPLVVEICRHVASTLVLVCPGLSFFVGSSSDAELGFSFVNLLATTFHNLSESKTREWRRRKRETHLLEPIHKRPPPPPPPCNPL